VYLFCYFYFYFFSRMLHTTQRHAAAAAAAVVVVVDVAMGFDIESHQLPLLEAVAEQDSTVVLMGLVALAVLVAVVDQVEYRGVR
jgi:hypothetical protein